MSKYSGPILPTIDSEYVIGRNEAIKRDNPNTATFIARTMQQHPDYFVQKFLDAQSSGTQLDAKEMEEYELAMLRERQGIVNPLR
jgi:hypothetical protein